MAWTTPRTWVTGELEDPTILNAHIRDNFNATGVGVVTTAGDMFYATGASTLTRLAAGSAGYYLQGGSAPSWQRFSFLHNSDATAKALSGSLTDGTLTTLIASGVTAGVVWGNVYDNTSGRALASGLDCALVDASNSPIYTSVAGNTLTFTLASGAIKVQRTAGTHTWEYYLLIVYR